MAGRHQAEACKVKELFIEHATLRLDARNFPRTQIDFDKTYEHFFSMDADIVNSNAFDPFLAAGRDLEAALEESIGELNREMQVEQKIRWYLERGGKQLVDEVACLMDEELDSYGDSVYGKVVNFNAKVVMLAEYRMQENIVRIPEKKFNATIQVIKLNKGDGRYSHISRLPFHSDSSFEKFLDVLRQATEDCAMPEEESCYPINSPPDSPVAGTSSASASTASSEATSQNDSQISIATSATLEMEAIHPLPKPKRTVRGFTLEDGPWYWTTCSDQRWSNGFDPMFKLEHYIRMIQALKKSKDSQVTVIHSVERQTQMKWIEELRLEAEDIQRRREEFRGLDAWGDGDEMDVGQSFMTQRGL